MEMLNHSHNNVTLQIVVYVEILFMLKVKYQHILYYILNVISIIVKI